MVKKVIGKESYSHKSGTGIRKKQGVDRPRSLILRKVGKIHIR